MGLYILSYGVDLQKVKRLFASKNEATFAAICATETFIGYADQDFAGAVTTEEALHQIIYGEPYDARSAHAYGYALISICDYLGIDLGGGTDLKLGYVTDLADEYLASDFGVDDVLTGDDLFLSALDLGLPAVADFPVSGFLQGAELEALHEQLRHIDITDEQVEKLLNADTAAEEEKGTAYEAIKSFKTRIDYCKQNQIQLVSFCH